MNNSYKMDRDIVILDVNYSSTVVQCIIDREDLELIAEYNGTWYAIKDKHGDYRVKINQKEKSLYLHRVVMKVTDSNIVVDHINHDTLDNRKSQLKATTYKNNSRNLKVYSNNTSGIPGVIWNKRTSKWRARIKVDGKDIDLGHFSSRIEAGRVATKARLNHFGSLGVTRFPIKLEVIS